MEIFLVLSFVLIVAGWLTLNTVTTANIIRRVERLERNDANEQTQPIIEFRVTFFHDSGQTVIRCVSDSECQYERRVSTGDEYNWLSLVSDVNGHYCPSRLYHV